ncbi:helix-turn-helix domain-containing protein [Neobacillus citreus]|uniref:Helix-turn-helix domain-containing protein n=1 Tax=Neobacillus citreus TaxID=2833578 RepID=A0A942T7A6_9BACI|nr:helix-turn-helix transcriptional regulator [Neobacillus citreus]MCH6269353.1 helix-turn-helix transcriptional regulator [Neobacillus citreus]
MAKKVYVKIHKLLDTYKISMRELSLLSDVRHAAISELANQKRKRIEFSHIEKIAEALDVKDIRQIIDLVDTDEEEE